MKYVLDVGVCVTGRTFIYLFSLLHNDKVSLCAAAGYCSVVPSQTIKDAEQWPSACEQTPADGSCAGHCRPGYFGDPRLECIGGNFTAAGDCQAAVSGAASQKSTRLSGI